MSRISSTSHQSSRRTLPSSNHYQPLLIPSPSSSSSPLPPVPPNNNNEPPESLFRSRLSTRDRTPSTSSNRYPPHENEHSHPRESRERATSQTGSGFSSSRRSRNRLRGDEGGGFGLESVAGSESGMSGFSVLSAFPHQHQHPFDQEAEARRRKRRQQRRQEKDEQSRRNREREQELVLEEEEPTTILVEDPTDSPLRRTIKWLIASQFSTKKIILICLSLLVLVKWTIGLGGYSGMGIPPMRGDFEAQRHWISLTSSTLSTKPFLRIPFTPIKIKLYHPARLSSSSNSALSTSTNTTTTNVGQSGIPISEWYSHDLSYWGLDYPPLTAYHSYLLGLLARLSPSTSQYVTLHPLTTASLRELEEWEEKMKGFEREGGMKDWMRATVLGGDLVLWVTAVAWYCWWNFGREAKHEKGRKMGEKALRRTLVAAMTILLQPALILIDNGHFQYNSIMLALTLWSINAFQSGHDLIGSVLFVASLGFKQMALYYAPGVFAYLLGKCLWLGGREGFNLFLHLGLTVALSFTLLFLPFLSPFPTSLLQSISRIFPFSRGLFEDKVANFWCTLNVIIKLRNLASVETLARVSLVMTGSAVLPSTVGVLYISHRLGQTRPTPSSPSATKSTSSKPPPRAISIQKDSANRPAPTSHLLPHLLLTSSLSFYLFSFQVHEKSILLPLMPLTLLMGAREKGYGRLDWEWGVLVNNVAVFSMFPLLKKDGLVTQYIVLTLLWNYLIGYNPFKLRAGSFVKLLSITSYTTILSLHFLELITTPPSHLPDLFPVLNLTMSCGVFGLAWLWGGKRLGQESWAIGGF
ncbi:hypothetical protein JCM16303_004946 [Sporobolomyces ruberrimus]